jgi:hypothetical protein
MDRQGRSLCWAAILFAASGLVATLQHLPALRGTAIQHYLQNHKGSYREGRRGPLRPSPWPIGTTVVFVTLAGGVICVANGLRENDEPGED